MKVLCVIDSLGSGGAQRQMINLAIGLKAEGYAPEFVVYHPSDNFFREKIVCAEIPIHEVLGVQGFCFEVVKKIANLIKHRRFDAVISFLFSPNVYCILAKILSQTKTCLIIGERASLSGQNKNRELLSKLLLYKSAAKIVTNSFHQTKELKKYFWLRKKIVTIYNGYPIRAGFSLPDCQKSRGCSFLVVGRIDKNKNGVALVKALSLFSARNGYVPFVSWAGRQERDQLSVKYREEIDQVIAKLPALRAHWQWLGERSDIEQILEKNDALIHVSLSEGLPNSVCEAFIAGRPVIASAICDNSFLVEDGVRGVLCDPQSPESICGAIERFTALSLEKRNEMGRNARRFAEKYLTQERMVAEYKALLA